MALPNEVQFEANLCKKLNAHVGIYAMPAGEGVATGINTEGLALSEDLLAWGQANPPQDSWVERIVSQSSTTSPVDLREWSAAC